jgi:UDP-glucose 4-epimerase
MAYKKIKVLVIGGSGFLGSHVADELLLRGYKVSIYDQKKSKWKKKEQIFYLGKLNNEKKLNKLIKNSDIVYNFAGIADLNEGSKKPLESINQNIYATAKIVESCIKYKIKRFIYSSTIYVYSNKGSFYKCSKQAAENYIEEYSKQSNLKFTILRFGSLYGPRSNYQNGLYKIVCDYLKNKKISYIGSKNTMREYIHINDAAKSCVDILEKQFVNKVIVITGKKKIYVKKILAIFSSLLKYKKEINFKNVSNANHYEKSPYSFSRNFGIKYFSENNINIKKGLEELISVVKQDNKL